MTDTAPMQLLYCPRCGRPGSVALGNSTIITQRLFCYGCEISWASGGVIHIAALEESLLAAHDGLKIALEKRPGVGSGKALAGSVVPPAPVGPEPAPGGSLWGYAWERDAERWLGSCTTRKEVIEEAMLEAPRDENNEIEGEIWITRGSPRKASHFLPARNWIIEHMTDAAYDEGAADGDWPEVSEEAEAELDRLLADWADKYCPEPLWVADGKPEKVWPKAEEP